MKQIIFYSILVGILFSKTKNWDAHSAQLLPQKRWEVGLFQPFRYGYSQSLEYSVHPLLFFVMPNASIKRSRVNVQGWASASRHGLVYPTPLLNMIAKEGTLGIIAPDFQMPLMLGISNDWLMTKSLKGFETTIRGGFDLGLVFGDLDKRSTIDLPLVYHRLGIYYNGWGLDFGLDVQKSLNKTVSVLTDVDFRFLPGLEGSFSIEHKLLLSWYKSEKFRVLSGYKFIYGEFPYGLDMRILPYVPIMEKWVPIIEFQWAGTRDR